MIRQAGSILMRHFGNTTNGHDKAHKGDVESQADLECEQFLVKSLKKIFPDDAVMTEEHPQYLKAANDRLWVVDALDGSRNFLLGIPLFGISMALVEKGVSTFGMVYFPILNELYYAQKGTGAYCNGKKIEVSQEREIDHGMISVIATAEGYDPKKASRIDAKLRDHYVWPINVGCMILPVCYVACGRYIGVIYTGARPWDVAGSLFIAQEAGAKVTEINGNPWNCLADPQHFIVANPALHNNLFKLIGQ